MKDKLTAGLVQLTASGDPEANLPRTIALVEEAIAGGAEFVLTPEMTGILEARSKRLFDKLVPEAEDVTLAALRGLAADSGIWLLIGSLAVLGPDGKARNRSYLINPEGEIASQYDKIHMFDVDLPDGESYRESQQFQAGDRAVLAETPWGPLGMTVCYDLRFPYLFRALALAGARILAVPAAFTRVTGEAHWHVLLRARAIENGCFVLAPAQTGEHSGGRQTFGHSLAVDPWGEILADGGTEVGVTIVSLDLSGVDRVRAKIPSLKHTVAVKGPK